MQIVKEFLTESAEKRPSEEVVRNNLEKLDHSTLFTILLSFEDYSTNFFQDPTECLADVVRKANITDVKAMRTIIYAILEKNPRHCNIHKHIQHFSQNAFATLLTLQDMDNETTVAFYFRALLLAYAYFTGRGTKPSDETALLYINSAVDIAEKLALNNSLTLAFKLLKLESRTSVGTMFYAKKLYYRFKKIEASLKKLDFSKPYTTSLDELRKESQSLSTQLSEDISLLDSKSLIRKDLEDFEQFFTHHFANLKLQVYLNDLSWQFPNPSSENLKSQLTSLEKDKDELKKISIDGSDLFFNLQRAGDFEYDNKEYYWAKLWYELHASLSSSPKILLKLAHMAANGQHSNVNQPGYIVKSDFPQAARFISRAIVEAIYEYDFQTAIEAVEFYKKLESNLTPEQKIDLTGKFKLAENTIINLNEPKSMALTFRIERLIKREKIENIEEWLKGQLLLLQKAIGMPAKARTLLVASPPLSQVEMLEEELKRTKEELAKANAKIAALESRWKPFRELLKDVPNEASDPTPQPLF